MNPFISVIICNYNYVKYLNRTLTACKKQTFKDFEIIFVDDCSTDNSKEVVQNFKIHNPEINITMILLDKNGGIGNARNTGIDAASGEYIIFNDSDDWMDTNCLEELANIAKKNKTDCVKGFYRHVNTNLKTINHVNYPKNCSRWCFFYLHASLYKRSIIIDNNLKLPVKVLVDEDIYFNIHFFLNTQNYSLCTKEIYNYYVHCDSLAGSKSNSKFSLPHTAMKLIFEIYTPVFTKVSEDDKAMLGYAIVRIYYTAILHSTRYSSLKSAFKLYDAAKRIMNKNLPGYLNYKNISFFKDNGDQPRIRKIISILFICERLGLMKLVIAIHIILSKIFYFS